MFPAPMEDEYRGGESATDWDIGGNFPGFTGWGGVGFLSRATAEAKA